MYDLSTIRKNDREAEVKLKPELVNSLVKDLLAQAHLKHRLEAPTLEKSANGFVFIKDAVTGKVLYPDLTTT